MNLPPTRHSTPDEIIGFYFTEAQRTGYEIAKRRKIHTWLWDKVAADIFRILIDELVLAPDRGIPTFLQYEVRDRLAEIPATTGDAA